MTSRAENWGAHDLDRRFDLGPPRDELTGLAATLDGLLERIAASRRHEQRFAAEMAHELRTPIAGLRGRAELALGVEALAEKDEALRSVVTQSGGLTHTVDTLLAVARRELDPGDGAFDPGVRGADETSAGAGLGLPPARRLARSCGGDVVLGDGPGGSFVLELPAVRSVRKR